MRKYRLFICAAGSLWTSGCSDAFLATVGLVEAARPDGGGQHVAFDPARGAAARRDGSAGETLDGGTAYPNDASLESADVGEARCVSLTDQSTPMGRTTDGGIIRAQSRDQSGCTTTIDSEAATSSIYWRADGELLIQRSRQYSFRWTGINQFPKLRLNGGADECSIDAIHQETNTNFYSLAVPDGCSAFTASIDARYIRLQTDWGVWFPSPNAVVFKLCEEACPAAH
jgi:hypothetical protein